MLRYPVLGLGLLGGGWLAGRIRALGGLSALPLILGALSLCVYFFMDMGAPTLLRNTGTPGLLIMAAGQLVCALVWAASCIAIGRRLWSSPQARERLSLTQPPDGNGGCARWRPSFLTPVQLKGSKGHNPQTMIFMLRAIIGGVVGLYLTGGVH
jgi:hypothetical protein